jgi:transcription initiation factor TFIID subunit 7
MRMKEHLFDKRVVQRALTEGLVDEGAYQRMLDALPDLSHKVQTAAESQALEAASQAASFGGVHAAPPSEEGAEDDYDDDDDDDEDDDEDDLDEEAKAEAPKEAQPVSDTLEMERPRIPGSYNPDY